MNRPVFYDDSGVRVVAMQWTARATCLLGALVCLAVVATLGSHVSLPALDRLNPFAGLSQRTDASLSADRPDAIEPVPRQVVNEDARRIRTERAVVVATRSTSPAERLTRLRVERPGRARTAGTEKVGGLTPAKTIQTPGATRADQNPIAHQLPGHRSPGHAAGSKAHQAQANPGRASTHPASRAAAAKSHPGAPGRTQSAEHVRTPKSSTQPASRTAAAKSHSGAPARRQSAKPAEPLKPVEHGSAPANAKP